MPHVQQPDPRIVWPRHNWPASSVVFAQNVITIATTPEKVWSLLINCVQWPQWYKRCSDVSVLRGGPLLEANCKFRFKTLGFYFEPEITTWKAPRMLVWAARGPAATSGAHAWLIEPAANGSRVITEESQTGMLLRAVRSRTRKNLLATHDEWLSSLKALAESK